MQVYCAEQRGDHEREKGVTDDAHRLEEGALEILV